MAIIRGTSDDDRIIAPDSDDQILAFRGNDFVDGGGGGNDRILADYGDDVVQGGAGADGIFGEHGNDTVDGGANNDKVYGGRGDDIGIHRLPENIGASDYYDGGEGVDTLRLVLTRQQANSAAVQADIEAFRLFLAQNNQPNSAGGATFQFTAFDLDARNWEPD